MGVVASHFDGECIDVENIDPKPRVDYRRRVWIVTRAILELDGYLLCRPIKLAFEIQRSGVSAKAVLEKRIIGKLSESLKNRVFDLLSLISHNGPSIACGSPNSRP